MKEKFFAILRTGTFKDNSGKEHTFTEKDLDTIAEKYNSGKDEAPIVVGHPKTNSPAFGWVEKLKRVGDKLFAIPKQLNEDFVEAVKKGAYKKISVSLYPDKKLRHVGFLGGAAPAVKGLPAVEFSEEEADSFEYEGVEFSEEEKKEKSKSAIDLSELKEAVKSISEKIAEFAEKLNEEDGEPDEIKIRLEKIEAENRKLQMQLRKNEFSEYLDEKLEKGTLTPAQKEKALKVFEFVASVDSFDFSEGEEDPEKIFKEFLDTLPKQIDFGEFSGNKSEKPSERDLAIAEIRESMKSQNVN